MAPKKKKLSREELLQKKREAERLRYQRKKNYPQKREEMREKEKFKYQKNKEKGLRFNFKNIHCVYFVCIIITLLSSKYGVYTKINQ